jgi:hypothetical protein
LQPLQIVRVAAGIVQQCRASSLVQGDGVLLAMQPVLLYADTRRAHRRARCEIYRPVERVPETDWPRHQCSVSQRRA